ncbi:MAG: hypothetical protein WD138_02170, partial [Halofilum sp. (in: g-proteobacteria)]
MVQVTDPQRTDVLEQGTIYFMYRPKVDEDAPEGVGDVERFFIALHPDASRLYRLIAIGGKRAPEIERHERSWGFVDLVTDDPAKIEEALAEVQYETKTRGTRTQPAARPAGQGAYAIAKVEDSGMHLVYALEMPERSDEVQRGLRIAPEASFALSIKNPEKGSPQPTGLSEDRQAQYPERLQKLFRDRQFDQEHPQLLDHAGAEIVLIGARTDPEEYGIELEPADEEEHTADILKDLRMSKS